MQKPGLCFFIFIVATLQMTSAQIDTNAVFQLFNVTFVSGGVTQISNTETQVFFDVAGAESNALSANTVPIADACSYANNPCDANANCTNLNSTGGIIQCTCPSGYNQTASTMSYNTANGTALIPDGTNCPDIDECAGNTTVCGMGTDQCFNTDGSYSCNCTTGYDYNSGDRLCEDTNECNNATLNNCHQNATCTNTGGSFTCQCNTGFSGDGVNCTEIDECVDRNINCGGNGNCVDPVGQTYYCNCSTGYEENTNMDPRTCDDIDECTMNTDNCDNNADCTNTAGSFTCACMNGFNGNGVTCTDIDECAGTNDCDANATCTNNAGSFMCTCNSGYSGNGTFCEASTINFCYRLSLTFDEPTSGDASSRANDADQAVQDFLTELTSGNVGFSYANYTSTLEAVLGNNTITEFIIELCLNESSQNQDQFTATLRDFNFTSTVGTDVITVLEFDECLDNYGNCSTNAACTNTNGSFYCTCLDTHADQSTSGMNGTICELPTNFTCSSNTVNVTAYNPYFDNLGINYTELILGDCSGTLSGNDILYYGECSPVIESNDTHISYKWNLTNVNETADITVGSYVTIPITCTYLRSQNVSFNISSERRDIIFNGNLNNQPGDAYEFIVNGFRNSDATQTLNGPVNTDTAIFFRVGTSNSLPSNVRIQVETFTTSAADGSSISLGLIKLHNSLNKCVWPETDRFATFCYKQDHHYSNGCPVSTTNVNRRIIQTLNIVRNGIASTALIAVDSHFFGQSTITVATFEVNACVESGGATSCEYSCGARRRRHVINARVKRQATTRSGEAQYAFYRTPGDICTRDCGVGGFCVLVQGTNAQECGCGNDYEFGEEEDCIATVMTGNSSPSESVTTYVLIGVAVFLLLVVVALVFFFMFRRRRNNRKEYGTSGYVNTNAIDNNQN